MGVQIGFLCGDATADMVLDVWTQVLAEANQPGSEVEGEIEGLSVAPQPLTPAAVKVGYQENDFGATILVTIAAPIAVHIVKSLWDDVVRWRLKKLFGVDVGDVITIRITHDS
jgi:hypothetical protein